MLGLASVCWGQDSQKKNVPPECTKIIRVRGSFPKWKGSINFLPKESYKGPPHIRYRIQEDGTVSDAVVTRGSGVTEIDKKVLDAIVHWKYKLRPVGCGIAFTEITVILDWDDSK